MANPPFSDKTWSHGIIPSADPYQRFVWGSPGEKGDYAYLLHIIRSMKCNGKAACILPHGVLFRGNAEAVIRKKLVRSGYLKGIIGLPANLFYGIPIPACILVLDKKNVNAHKGIFMINASKGFIKDGPKNRLREQDIHRIVDTFNRQTDTPRYARIVPIEEVADPKNNYNLNLPRYIDSSEPEDIQDIRAHLNGGIPNRDIDGDKKAIPPSEGLNHYWAVMPSLRIALFKNNGHKDYSELRVEIKKIKATISGHEEFAAFKAIITGIFDKWQAANVKRLKGFDQDGQPKELITTIAEDLLAAFKAAPLLDCYGMYQHLMDYWVATMQDDCYLIAADGWVAETRRVLEKVKSGKKKGEMREKGWACDLIPKRYIVARYFAKQRGEIEALQTELDDVSASLTELAEEHDGDEGALKDVSTKGDAEEAYTKALIAVWDEDDNAACDRYNSSIDEAQEYAVELRELTDHHNISVLKNRRGNLTLKAIRDRLALTDDKIERKMLKKYLDAYKRQKSKAKEAAELLARVKTHYRERLYSNPLLEKLADLQVTVCYLELLEEQSALKSKVKEAETALDQFAYGKYPTLSVNEIKTLVVDDKWLPALTTAVRQELNRVSQTLTGRIRQLAERYETPLPQLTDLVADLSTRVKEHLANMGAV